MGAAASVDQLSSFKTTFEKLSDLDKIRALENAEKILNKYERDSKTSHGSVFVRLIRARNLRSADGIFSESDPYVLIRHGDAPPVRSKTARNERSPNWNEKLEMKLDNSKLNQRMRIEVWDNDGGKGRDDPLGYTRIKLFSRKKPLRLSSRPITRELVGRGAAKGCSLTFMYWWGEKDKDDTVTTSLPGLNIDEAIPVITSRVNDMDPKVSLKVVNDLSKSLAQYKAQEETEKLVDKGGGDEGTTPKEEATQSESIVTRKELRTMSTSEQVRFANALDTMMKNKVDEDGKDIKQSSEFFRLAGYHGWPNDYCTHRQELFPGWHRAYLVDFEKCLRVADIANGGDGNIGLPYWDWTRVINNEVMPAIIRDRFASLPSSVLGEDLDPSSPGGKLASIMFKRMPNEKDLLVGLTGARLEDAVQRALEEEEHFKAVSTRWRGGSDVESPHNSVHVACGFPMTSVYYAAFHPIFFLHHCNVDRVYESYIKQHPDSQAEFKATQQRLSMESGEENRYETPLKPFNQSLMGGSESTLMTAADTFVTETLGYVYDHLPIRRPPQMQAAPTYAVFKDVDPTKLENKSYQIHIFLLKKDQDHAAFREQIMPSSGADAMPQFAHWSEVPEYAGNCGVFGGKGAECSNCAKSGSIYVKLDVSSSLIKLALSRHQASLCCVCIDEVGDIVLLDATPLPTPSLEGPFFAHFESTLKTDSESDSPDLAEETRQLQKILNKYGYYKDSPDGVFGELTTQAVKGFQQFSGVEVDGAAGPITKSFLLASRFDADHDVISSTESNPFSSDRRTIHPTNGNTVTYKVGIVPGYLNQADVEAEISTVLMAWGYATGLEFVLHSSTDNGEAPSIVIRWAEPSDLEDNLLRFDGPGGCIAQADVENNHIVFDSSEKWFVNATTTSETETEEEDEASPPDGHFNIGAVVIHEMGHILGLRAHSPHAEDVMSPFYVGTAGRLGLGPSDLKRIHGLYDNTPEVGLVLSLPKKK